MAEETGRAAENPMELQAWSDPAAKAAPLRSLAVKIAEVIAAVGWVEKRGRNTQQSYDYATESDMLDAVRGELSKRHVVILPTVDSVEVWHVQGREKALPVTRVWVTFLFVDGDTGETLERRFPGDGMDAGDKGIYKAITGAEKYCVAKTFMLPTGDDPEKDEGEKPKRRGTEGRAATGTGTPAPAPGGPITPKQAEFFRSACKNQGIPTATLCGEFGVETIEELPAASFNAALAFLKKAAK